MNTSPLIVLMLPVSIVALLVFLSIYDRQSATADLERDRMRLERMKFDQDFSAAWNGEDFGPSSTDDEIQALREQIAEKESALTLSEDERCRKMGAFANKIDAILSESGGRGDFLADCPQKH